MRFVLIYKKAIDAEVLSRVMALRRSQTLSKACLSSKAYPYMHMTLGNPYRPF